MIHNQLGFDEHHVLHHLKHYLPAQNPLKDFVHHNTLHAFQNKNFFEALHESSEVFGYKTYLSLNEFRVKYANHEISHEVLHAIITKRKGADQLNYWLEVLLNTAYDESRNPRIGSLRAHWKNDYAINLEKSTYGILFKILCSYLDQGVAISTFPIQNTTFLNAIKELEKTSSISLFKGKRAIDLLQKNASIKELLHIIVGDESYFEQYLFDQQFGHPGWSGMVATIEDNPSSLLDKKMISLSDLITFELLLEIDVLDQKFNTVWAPLSFKITQPPIKLFKTIGYDPLFETLSIWQEAFEWTLYDQVLSGIQHVKNEVKSDQPSFQAMFCMDDRECSFRRHIEHQDPNAATFGTPAFFNFEFFYQPVNGKFFTKLCPAPVTPKFLIKEKNRKKKQAKDLLYHKRSHSLFFGWIISQTLGFSSAFKLFLNIFRPSMTPATSASFKHLHKKSKLIIENSNPNDVEEGLQIGFSLTEMADRVEGLLKSIGLVADFSPIVYVVGHGATSVNNTHYAGYDCGACCGRPSSVNAKVAAFAANHSGVRKLLKQRGIDIPSTCQFLPALHDTTRDEIVFYDEDSLSELNKELHLMNELVFSIALDHNAKERSRRFDTIDSSKSLKNVHEKIKLRSVSLFEPRPELNHATNAMCIVGRRSLSKQLFLDRRAFMNSFDYTIDPTGDYLAGILGAVAPVGGGINLEYYFSRVDNQKLGAGTKLPHNVMGLIGVANGMDGDLRPGLPMQMVEVHDPIRLLIVVEHFPEIVKYAISKNENTYQWFKNQWVKLVVVHPETFELFHFENEQFETYTPIQSSLQVTDNELEWAEKSKENLPILILN